MALPGRAGRRPGMSPDLWARIEEVLDALLEHPTADWPSRIDELCGDDPELEGELRSLVGRDPDVRGFLAGPLALAGDDGEAPPAPTLEGRRLGPYVVGRELARGGMGWIYVAEDTALGRRVALKVLPPDVATDPERLARFEREARIVAALNHPNIVTIHSIEEADGVHFLTMELVEGRSLDREVREGPVSVERFLAIAIPLATAVDAAHGIGVTHRDLKPANVMVTDEGRVKVLDFGIAKAPAGAVAATELTDPGATVGTLAYMAPEQVDGREVDHRSDLFSLGVLFFELLTGVRPFQGESRAATAAAILRDDPPRLGDLRSGLPAEVERLVHRCLEKDSARRFQKADELVGELEALRHGALANAGPKATSIAVLRFADMSPQKDQEYFCEGIADELITALGRVGDLRVASRTSSFRFRDAAEDVREIGRRLRVSTVLEGSVRKAGDRIRVTAQLVDAATGYRLWSDRYDRDTKDIFAIQEEIAERIVDALALTLNPRERRAIRQVSTRDVEAYEYYLRGRRFFYRMSRRGSQFARQLYERAIELDPNYALAYVGLADAHSFLAQYAVERGENLDRADAASRRALDLDPELAEAHASRGLLLSLRGRHDEAREAFATAVRLDPKLYEAHYFFGRACQTAGAYADAARLFERAATVRPEEYEAARLLLKSLAGLGAPPVRIEEAARRALRRVEERLDLSPDDSRAYSFGAPCALLVGDLDRSREWSARARELEPDDPVILYNQACLLALSGRGEEALDALERAAREGFSHREWVVRDAELAGLRDQPGFAAALELMDRGSDG